MIDKALRWTLMVVMLLSVLFPVGAYYGVVMVLILAIKARRSRQLLAGLMADIPVLIMLASIMLSFIYSKDRLMSLGGIFLISLNVVFYLVSALEMKKIRLQSHYLLINTACILACIYGLYQFFGGNIILQKSWVDENTFGSLVRIYSTLLNPNIFAAYLAMNLSFGLGRFRSLREDILLTVNIMLSSVCLLLTYSRGGFAAFCAGMLVLCLLKERNKGLAIYSAAMAGAFFLLNSTGYMNRAGLTGIYQDSSSLYRYEIWKASLNMFLENPIFGHGVGTTWYYLSSGSEKLYRYILHSHNIYLQIAAEMGITGICAFIYLAAGKTREALMLLNGKTSEEEGYIVQGFLASLGGIAVHGLIDAVVFVPAMSLIFVGYSALYCRVVSEYRDMIPCKTEIYPVQGIRTAQLFYSKCVLKLFSGKGTCKEKYQEEESKAYQA